MPSPRSPFRRGPGPVRRFGRCVRGSASVELAIGGFVLIAAAMLVFDLYSLMKADTASARMAVTMADYVSFETAPSGDDIADLGRYLHAHDLGIPAALVYVISSVRKPPGDADAVVLWRDDSIRLGDADVTASLVQTCTERAEDGWRNKLVEDGPERFALNANDVIFIVEVCARLLREGMLTSRFITGDLYHLHATPARDTTAIPAAPVHSPPDPTDTESTVSLEGPFRG